MSNMSKGFTFCMATCVAFAIHAAECMSDSAFVILRPETSSFWTTATNSSMSVPVEYPKSSQSAIGFLFLYPAGAVCGET